MNMRTLRYKRIHIEHDDADTKRTLSPECSSEMLTETEADKTLSDTELLDIMRSSYDVIREHGRDDDYVSVLRAIIGRNITLQLLLDIGSFLATERVSNVRYNVVTMKFWGTVYKLFKGKAILVQYRV